MLLVCEVGAVQDRDGVERPVGGFVLEQFGDVAGWVRRVADEHPSGVRGCRDVAEGVDHLFGQTNRLVPDSEHTLWCVQSLKGVVSFLVRRFAPEPDRDSRVRFPDVIRGNVPRKFVVNLPRPIPAGDACLKVVDFAPHDSADLGRGRGRSRDKALRVAGIYPPTRQERHLKRVVGWYHAFPGQEKVPWTIHRYAPGGNRRYLLYEDNGPLGALWPVLLSRPPKSLPGEAERVNVCHHHGHPPALSDYLPVQRGRSLLDCCTAPQRANQLY